MTKKSQTCISCGQEKGKDDFDRFEGGKVWSPTCRACLAEHERVRAAAAEDARRAREAAAEIERQRRVEALRIQRDEDERRRQEAAAAASAQIAVLHAQAVAVAPETPKAETETADAAVLESLRRQEARIDQLASRIERWEFFHHPIRTIAFGMVAGFVVMTIIYGLTFLALTMILGGGGGILSGQAPAQALGLIGLLLGILLVIGVLTWLSRLLRR